jgi:hypothetical protein
VLAAVPRSATSNVAFIRIFANDDGFGVQEDGSGEVPNVKFQKVVYLHHR